MQFYSDQSLPHFLEAQNMLGNVKRVRTLQRECMLRLVLSFLIHYPIKDLYRRLGLVEQRVNFSQTYIEGTKNEKNPCTVVTCNQNDSKGE